MSPTSDNSIQSAFSGPTGSTVQPPCGSTLSPSAPSPTDVSIQPCNDGTPPLSRDLTQLTKSTQLTSPSPTPFPSPVNGAALLDDLAGILRRFVVLPPWAAETLAIWILHTYAFQLRDVTTYIGIESPQKRCGKTTLLSVLEALVNRPIASSNISPPAFFRVIEDLSPTLLIDEADTFLKNNDQLRGILNSGYSRKTAFILRAGARSPTPDESDDLEPAAATGVVTRFSCWCPKAMAAIGSLPDTLADRCIVIRMRRKTQGEECARLRLLQPGSLRSQCARFVLDHSQQIAAASPQIPAALNDRSADIWEPLLALADLAGGEWPQTARHAASALSAASQETTPIGSMLLDILAIFTTSGEERLFTSDLLDGLSVQPPDRPWMEPLKGRPPTYIWLARQLRPYGVRPRNICIGDRQAKGYVREDFQDTFQRYITRSDFDAFLADNQVPPQATADPNTPASSPS